MTDLQPRGSIRSARSADERYQHLSFDRNVMDRKHGLETGHPLKSRQSR
jgi:hypothetical protein